MRNINLTVQDFVKLLYKGLFRIASILSGGEVDENGVPLLPDDEEQDSGEEFFPN
jgi:hypothetical protein